MKEAAELIAELRARAKRVAPLIYDQYEQELGYVSTKGRDADPLCAKAADHIETLEARVATLSEALEAYEAFHNRIFCTGFPLEQYNGAPIDHTDLNHAHELASSALAAREATR